MITLSTFSSCYHRRFGVVNSDHSSMRLDLHVVAHNSLGGNVFPTGLTDIFC